jgi:starvation-inducible outer membrane lipoprotein
MNKILLFIALLLSGCASLPPDTRMACDNISNAQARLTPTQDPRPGYVAGSIKQARLDKQRMCKRHVLPLSARDQADLQSAEATFRSIH